MHKAFAPAIVGMSGQIHVDFLRLLWVPADKQMRWKNESMGKDDKIGNEAFRWARAKVFNSNKTSVGRAIAFGCTTRCHLSVHSLAMPRSGHHPDPKVSADLTGHTYDGRCKRLVHDAINVLVFVVLDVCTGL